MRLLVADIVQGNVARFRLLIDQHRMALRKRAALAVLAGEADRIAFIDKRPEGERLAHRPIDALASLDHFAPVFDKALDGAMEMETLWNRGEAKPDFGKPRTVDAGAATAILLGAGRCRPQAGPAAIEPIGLAGLEGLARLHRGFKMVPPIGLQLHDLAIG